MAPPPRRNFEDEEESSSDEESSSEESAPAIKSRAKFDDEEDDSDVVDDWEAEDSEAEREKAKKEKEAKDKAAAAAAAKKKSKTERVNEHISTNAAARKAAADEDSEEEEDEGARRRRLQAEQQEAGIQQAQDLFGQVDLKKQKTAPKTLVNVDPSDPNKLADLSELPLFSPNTKNEFENLRLALAPLLSANGKKPQYTLFLTELVKQAAKEMPSDQIKKVASALTTLSNERMKQEKDAEKGGKKSKAAKTKASLVANRNVTSRADVEDYGDELADDDFM